LYGDQAVERLHARIVRSGDRFLLIDAGTKSGTFLNGQRIARQQRLHNGDMIVMGNSVLRFGERCRKRSAPYTTCQANSQ
jgi:pSer/pThr/pTyr-binding forkhead associated (FHA) protein